MTVESQGVGILPTAFTESYFSDLLKKIPDAPVYTKPLCLAYRKDATQRSCFVLGIF